MASYNYEPLPRIHHTSAQVDNKVVVCGGNTKETKVYESSYERRNRLASTVEVFHPLSEEWEVKKSTGTTPASTLSSASCNGFLFAYEGEDLYQLSTKTFEWRKLPGKGELPMYKEGAAMVACGDDLALLGGLGFAPCGPLHDRSSFVWISEGGGYTNEFNIYHLNEGMQHVQQGLLQHAFSCLIFAWYMHTVLTDLHYNMCTCTTCVHVTPLH